MGTKKEKKVSSEDSLETTIASENHFVGNMAHRLRTLSNAIMGFSELLGHEQLTNSQNEYVSEICQAASGLVSLVNDAVDLSKIEANNLDINISSCSMNWLLGRIDSLMRTSAEEKGLEFELVQCMELPEKQGSLGFSAPL